jgi:hypothetical protein
VVERSTVADPSAMNKRNVATVLWFLMGWVMGSALAIMVGLPTLLGAMLAFPSAALIRLGPGRRLWSADSAAPTTVSTSGHSTQLARD